MKNRGEQMVFLLIVILTCIAQHTSAQHFFEKVYGGGGSDVSVKVVNAGSRYVLAGTTTSQGAGSYDVCLIQTDTFGNLLSCTTVGGFAEDVTIAAAATVHKEYLLAGYTNSFGSDHPFFMKFNQTGTFIWGKQLTTSGWAQGVAGDADGNIYITGYHSNPDPDVFLVKCDSSGNFLWEKSFGDSLLNEGRMVIASQDGGVLVCGITHVQAGGPTDAFVLKADSSGNLLWSYRYAVPSFFSWDLGYAIQEIGSDIVLGALSYSEAFNPNPNSADALIVILDSLGNVKKGMAIGSVDYDDLRNLHIDDSGRICLTGATNHSGNGNTDILLVCFDTTGLNLDQITFGGSTFDHGLSVTSATGGNYLVAGYSESFGGGLEDMYLIKTDASYLSCDANPGMISIVPIQILQNSVFDITPISTGVLSPLFSVTNTPLVETTLCITNGIKSSIDVEEISVFPNPFDEYLNIRLPYQLSSSFMATLFDPAGRFLHSQTGKIVGKDDLFRISTQDLPKGIYFLRVESEGTNYFFHLIRQ